MTQTRCELCFELDTGCLPTPYRSAAESVRREHRRHGTATTFAAITPLREEHFLVVPARHVTGAAQLSTEESRHVTMALDALLERAHAQGVALLVFEHGIARHEEGGCGISHVHLHALFAQAWEIALAIEAVQDLEGAVDLDRPLPASSRSYLFASSWGEGPAVLVEGSFPSQTLRRLVAPILESAHRDWRSLTNWADFTTTDRRMAAVVHGASSAASDALHAC